MIRRTHVRNQLKSHPRSGIALVLAIIVLILSSSIALAMLRTTTLRHQRFEMRQWKLQSELIADSALDRVAQQLSKQQDAVRETWQVTANGETGVAIIQTQKTEAGHYEIKIVSRYPSQEVTRAQTTLESEISSLPAP